jgi:hypothetical protein
MAYIPIISLAITSSDAGKTKQAIVSTARPMGCFMAFSPVPGFVSWNANVPTN